MTTRHGYKANHISVVMSDDTRKRHFGDARPGRGFKEGTKAAEGAGIPEHRAAEYERGLKEGGILLGTRAKDEVHATELERDFTGYGARNVRR